METKTFAMTTGKPPITRPGTVKVRVRATGICGSDVPRVLHNGAHFYPVVLGHEFSGDVVEVGEGVTGLQVGDTVSGAPLVPCMKCGDCQRGNFALCKHYSLHRQPRAGQLCRVCGDSGAKRREIRSVHPL